MNPFASRSSEPRVASDTGTPLDQLTNRLRRLGAPAPLLTDVRLAWGELDDAERGYALELTDEQLRRGIATFREHGTLDGDPVDEEQHADSA